VGSSRERARRVPYPPRPLAGLPRGAPIARIQILVTDLMLSSKVSETLSSAGHELLRNPQPSADAELIVADLDAVDAAQVAAAGPPTLGFYQHTDVVTRRRAEEAGFDLVVARSRMARELPELVEALLS